jgi:hypothetical protein
MIKSVRTEQLMLEIIILDSQAVTSMSSLMTRVVITLEVDLEPTQTKDSKYVNILPMRIVF